MKKVVCAVFALAILASCDYTKSSNGNIDAAFARELPKSAHGDDHGSHETSETSHGTAPDTSAHGGDHHPSAEVSPAASPVEAYDTTAQEHKKAPVGEVVAVDTIPLGKKGQLKGTKADPNKKGVKANKEEVKKH